MSKKQKQVFSSGKSLVHFTGTGQTDYALCGQDLAGDSIDDRGVYEAALPTDEKVNCADCIRIVEYCKSIKETDYEGGICPF